MRRMRRFSVSFTATFRGYRSFLISTIHVRKTYSNRINLSIYNMHFSAILLPVFLAFSAIADPLASNPDPLPQGVSYARQYRREVSHLAPRLDVDPNLVCGSGYDDCKNGWCCGSGQSCAGTLNSIPVCKDPNYTFGILKGTAIATPYKNLESVAASMSQILASLTAGPAAGAAATGTTGAAAALNVPGNFGKVATVVLGAWGFAGLLGAGWFLM
ncbi:uncharacterized protein BDR25DRAFT_44493 [Lindgomyces ingoldianus]|uniref:Uncharacterized protein n=1 Tax=Lindgomyces ingoldianus TaxID=673940 RepID=A0ACB6REQ6_9PLEO|nr:uncharacterized protein BDR25DRAFT_44493 [Lindgomyces ingoldianus]KAF2477233.1 hypothetical protein BDR25DRAFT_44493 [Lindgomyces ingoldianus]